MQAATDKNNDEIGDPLDFNVSPVPWIGDLGLGLDKSKYVAVWPIMSISLY